MWKPQCICKPHLASGLLEKLLPSSMTDQECTESTAPFLPFNHWMQACWVCVCVFDCVNAPLRLPEFICLVSYSTTPFSNFYSSCYGITSLLSSPVLRSFPLSVTQSNTDEAPHLINLQHELRGVLWMLRMIIHMLEKVHSPAHMLNSAVVTDVAQTHTWSMSSYPLSWRPCAFFK